MPNHPQHDVSLLPADLQQEVNAWVDRVLQGHGYVRAERDFMGNIRLRLVDERVHYVEGQVSELQAEAGGADYYSMTWRQMLQYHSERDDLPANHPQVDPRRAYSTTVPLSMSFADLSDEEFEYSMSRLASQLHVSTEWLGSFPGYMADRVREEHALATSSPYEVVTDFEADLDRQRRAREWYFASSLKDLPDGFSLELRSEAEGYMLRYGEKDVAGPFHLGDLTEAVRIAKGYTPEPEAITLWQHLLDED